MSAAARKRDRMLAAAHRSIEARAHMRELLVTGRGSGGLRREKGATQMPMIVDEVVPFFMATGEADSFGGPSANRAGFNRRDIAGAAHAEARRGR